MFYSVYKVFLILTSFLFPVFTYSANLPAIDSLPVTDHKFSKKISEIDPQKEIEDETLFDSLDPHEILKRLFDHPSFGSPDSEAVWAPDYEERMTMTVSPDLNCHTAIDTIMYFDAGQSAAVVFGTYFYHPDTIDDTKTKRGGYGCHFCGIPTGIALFSKTGKNNWKIYKFSKAIIELGLWGGDGENQFGESNRGKFSLIAIGQNQTCISFKQPVGGNCDEFTGSEYWYSIEQYDLKGLPNAVLCKILNFEYYRSRADLSKKDRPEIVTERKIKLIIKQNAYYDLEMVTQKNRKHKIARLKYSGEEKSFRIISN